MKGIAGIIGIATCLATARAQNVIHPESTISGVPAADGYAYTLTLENAPTSTQAIEMFWFAWLPGEGNFLPSAPTAVQAPSGWTALVTNDSSMDGFGIQFQTSVAALAPGASLSFGFKSTDSPNSLMQNSPYYNGIPALSSVVYSGHLFGTRVTFLPTFAPEPPAWALGAAGAGMMLIMGRRRRA
jgi:hypothetical protein